MNISYTVLGLLERVHEQVATFARDNYASEGRGVVLVDFPDLNGSPETVVAALQYTRQNQLRTLFSGGKGREDAKNLAQLVERYDPAVQAVVNVRLHDQDFCLMVRLIA